MPRRSRGFSFIDSKVVCTLSLAELEKGAVSASRADPREPREPRESWERPGEEERAAARGGEIVREE